MKIDTELSRKSIASRLAKLICSDNADNIEVQRLMCELEPDKVENKIKSTPPAPAIDNDDSVGIWKRQQKGDASWYVRDSNRIDEWPYWAQVHEILPKSHKKRILLLGESVARGYLFDPYYCPASVLENTLNDSRLIDAEVIDLARTNLDLSGLMKVCAESTSLNPDALLIFAGNNWFYTLKRSLAESDYANLITAMETEGLQGFEKQLSAKFKTIIRQLLIQLGEIVAFKNIPVVILIPEFNLTDWKSSVNESIPTALPNETLRKWMWIRNEAEEALKSGNVDEAVSLAKDLVTLDCSHPVGYEILAACYQRRGQYVEARKYLESARDTAVFARAFSKPRSHAVIRQTLLQEANEYNIQIVDLPEVFATETGRLPDRDLFLDYCHLTEKGIQLAMRAAAGKLVEVVTHERADQNMFNSSKFIAGKEVKGVAYLCAAVHNAHYGQTHDVLDHWCRKAADTSPVAVQIMENYVDFASRRVSTALCKTHEKLVENEWITQYAGGIGFLHKPGQKIMDVALVDSMVRALETKGIAAREKVKAIRKQEHGVNNSKRNLLESFYHTTSYDNYPGVTPGYYQSRNVESAFHVVAEAGTSIAFTFTYRTPDRSGKTDKLIVLVNGSRVAEFGASDRWTTQHFDTRGANIFDGVNELRLVWSSTFDFTEKPGKAELTDDFIMSRLFKVYGELMHFTAEVAQ